MAGMGSNMDGLLLARGGEPGQTRGLDSPVAVLADERRDGELEPHGLKLLVTLAVGRVIVGRVPEAIGSRPRRTAEAWRDGFSALLPRTSHAACKEARAVRKTTVTEEAFLAAAWAEGRAMTLEQAVAYALDEPPSA
jgi:hypothetical protein